MEHKIKQNSQFNFWAFNILEKLSGLTKASRPLGLCLGSIFVVAANFLSSAAMKQFRDSWLRFFGFASE